MDWKLKVSLAKVKLDGEVLGDYETSYNDFKSKIWIVTLAYLNLNEDFDNCKYIY